MTALRDSEASGSPAAWPREELAGTWRRARSSHPQGYLNAAACNVPSDRVLDAVIAHLRLERAVGGYEAAAEAAPVLDAGRTALAAYVGAAAQDVAFTENGTAGMAAVLGGWRLPEGARVGMVRSEYGSNRMLLWRLAEQRGWTLVELPVDGDSRILLDGLTKALADGLDLVVFPHIASQRGIVQPAQAAGRLCRDAGVPLVLDVCQSLGHVQVAGTEATAYVGTSRKWLAGPRGAGFLIVPGLAEGTGPDALAPTLGGHTWAEPGGRPVRGALRYEHDEAGIATRVGLATAVQEHQELGPAEIYARLAAIGRATRALLDGVGGWRAVEPIQEPTAIVTLRPPAEADPVTAVTETGRAARSAGLQVAAITTARAPADMPTPVLRVSLSVGAEQGDVLALARLLT